VFCGFYLNVWLSCRINTFYFKVGKYQTAGGAKFQDGNVCTFGKQIDVAFPVQIRDLRKDMEYKCRQVRYNDHHFSLQFLLPIPGYIANYIKDKLTGKLPAP
jgi:hypothetical protein